MFGGVRDRKMCDARTSVLEEGRCFAAEIQGRNSLIVVHDLDVMPCDLATPSRLQCLQKCLLRGEPSRVGLRRGRTFRVAIAPLGNCENALDEPRCPLDRFCDTIDLDDIDAG